MNKYAFPRKLPAGEFPPKEAYQIMQEHAGMTLREYTAIKIAAALHVKHENYVTNSELTNRLAIEMADDLLKQLKET